MSNALLRRIDREALKAAKQNKRTFKLALRNSKRKPVTKCQKCGAEGETRQYVCDANIAVTYNSPHLCHDCYHKTYDE